MKSWQTEYGTQVATRITLISKNLPVMGTIGDSPDRLTLIGNHNVVVKSFTLDVPKKNYKKGEALDLDNIIITAKMSDGSTKTYSWSGAKAAGFKSNPENKTILNEIGEKTVTIYKNVDGKNIEQTFKIKVSMDKPETPAEDQIPAKVEVYKDGKQVKSIDSLDSKKFENAEGYLLADMKAIKLPESLKNSLNSKIVFKVYNKAGELLDVEAVHAKKFAGHDTVDVKIPGYKSPKYKVGTDYNVGFLKFMVDWEADATKTTPKKVVAKKAAISDEEQPALNVSETNDASSPKNEGKAELEKSGENSPNNEKLETNAKSKVMDEKPSEAEDKKSDAAEK